MERMRQKVLCQRMFIAVDEQRRKDQRLACKPAVSMYTSVPSGTSSRLCSHSPVGPRTE